MHGCVPLQPGDDPVRGDDGVFEMVEAHHQPEEWGIGAGDVVGTWMRAVDVDKM